MLQKIKRNAVYLTTFFTGQILLQFINMLNGFFLLRWLSIEEQAKFSVAFGIQTFILSLSDMGFTGSIIALVGINYADKELLGRFMVTVKKMRYVFFIIAVAISLLVVPIISKKQSWNSWQLFIIHIPVLLAVFAQINTSLYEAPLVMNKKMKDLYLSQVILAGLKLGANFLLHLSSIINSLSTLIINCITIISTGRFFRKAAKDYFIIKPEQSHQKEYAEIIRFLKPQLPGFIFFAFYGQFQVFLISFLGKTTSIAEVAALGRLSQLFVLLNVFNGLVIAPFIARTQTKEVLRNYLSIFSFAFLLVVVICCSVLWFPHLYLFLLGAKYFHLEQDLIYIIISACLSYIGGVLYTMNIARKWILWWNSWAYILWVIVAQVLAIFFFDCSTTKGVLLAGIFVNMSTFLFNIIVGLTGYLKLEINNR